MIVNVASTFVLLLAFQTRTCVAQALAWSPQALNQIYVLAQGMDREVVSCGRVQTDGDSLRVMEFSLPYMWSSDTASTRADECPHGTGVIWHNHPWTGPMEAEGITKPAELCALSRSDQMAGIASRVHWVAVSVGRADPRFTWLCWWNQGQLQQHPLALPSVEGQRLKFWTE